MNIINKVPGIAIGLWILDNVNELVFGQPEQPPLMFQLVDDAVEHYKQFITNLRNRLASGFTSHGIQVLRNPATVANNQQFLLLQLSNEQHLTITLALNVTTAYVVAYRAENRSYFFRDIFDSARRILFTDTHQTWIPFEGNYSPLESDIVRVAQARAAPDSQHIINRESAGRMNISLGMAPLQAAISSLFHYDRNTLAKSFIVIIQMISEAARFRYIEQLVLQSIETYLPFTPDPCMHTLENNWGRLSTAVQRSNGQGEFRRANQFQLIATNGQIFFLESVTQVLQSFGLALIQYTNPEHEEQ